MKKRLAIVAACCTFALALGLVGCGGSSSGSSAASASGSSASSGASAASTSAGAAGGDAKDGYVADGYIDEFGIVTAKALIELDGAELGKVVEAAKYEWDDKHAEWSRIGSELAPIRGLSEEDYEAAGSFDTAIYAFSLEEIAGFAAGGKGEPVEWLITSKAKIDDVDTVLAIQQVTVLDQCEIEHKSFGREIWAIVQNGAGDKFLLCARHYDDKSVVDLYTQDYIARSSHGIASHFSSGEYLLYDAHTIDEIWPILQSGEVS